MTLSTILLTPSPSRRFCTGEIQELISVGFAVEFIPNHLREVARAVFMRRVQPVIDAIDTRIETLKKVVADLEGRRKRLLSGIGGPSRFGDQTLISGLR